MVKFETVNELSLRVTADAGDEVFTKAGAFIAGTNGGAKNYKFDKVMFGPDEGRGIGRALLGQVTRRLAGENLPLMKVMFSGPSETYYASYGQHVVIYHLDKGEVISLESENILAFTADCDYSVRFIGVGLLSQKGLATSTLKAKGPNAYVAVICDGNPLVLSNREDRHTISVDPDAVVCWIADNACDPEVKADVSWKTFIGQASGESYQFEWSSSRPVTVIIQPSERGYGSATSPHNDSSGSIRFSVD